MRNLRFINIVVALPFVAATLIAAFPEPPAAGSALASRQTIVLAGGCFWGMQGIFEHVKGVTDTEVGYAGGEQKTAHYEMVSEGNTGHAESLKITYDPSKIAYGQLLKIYFSVAHDPTTVDRQHSDVGPQYRSSIFYTTEEQKKIAEAYIQELNDSKAFRSPIATKVVPLKAFYAAEAYHQHFLDNNPTQGYIAAVDIPLLENFKRTYPEFYKR